MPVPAHLEEAAARLSEAVWRIDQAKAKPLSEDTQREWLSALTDFSLALSDIQRFNNESIHEKLQGLDGRVERLTRAGSSAEPPVDIE
ncbi:MAG TPA: hypothetical protein VFN94_01340 [Nitrospiria bacterium]|nr:hypothetical protein [Nitrospiria bacterium]